jgi:hypothetical protein
MDHTDDFKDKPEGFEMLEDALVQLHSNNPELALRIKEELNAAARGEENILLVGTDGEFSVTILHLDPELVNWENEIVLFPTSSSVSILAAVSRDYLEEKIRACESMEQEEGGAPADNMWDNFMSELMHAAVEKHRANPRTF